MGTRESLNGRKKNCRLDFLLPPLSAPRSPRMGFTRHVFRQLLIMLYEVVSTFPGEYVDVLLARGHINETTNCTNYKSFEDCHIKNLDEMVI